MSFPGITNYAQRLEDGTMCHFGVRDSKRHEWIYSLWRGEGDSETCFKTGTLDLKNIRFHITPEMAAKLVALTEGLEVS